MRFSRHANQQAQLQRYWDALVTGASSAELERLAAPLDRSQVDLIAHVRSEPETIRPGPAFVNELEHRVMDAYAGAPHDPIPLRPDLRLIRQRRAFPRRERAGTADRREPTARLLRGFGSAVLAVIVILLLVVAVVDLIPQRNGPASVDDVPAFRGGAMRTGEQPGPGPSGTPVVRWTVVTQGRLVGSPSVAGGVVYVGADDGVLHALDARSGTERWRATLGGAIGAAPAIVDGVLYAGDQAGNLYALDAATGEQRWRVSVGAGAGASLYASSPVVVDGALYIASGGGASSPAVADGVVYVGGSASISLYPPVLHAFDAATGSARWRFPATTGATLDTPGVYAVDAATGSQRWKFSMEGDVRGAPAVAGGVVYAGSRDGMLAAIDATSGTERWHIMTGKAITSSPAVADGTVYVGSTDGKFYAVDAATGKARWTAPVGVVQNSAPAVVDTTVYVVADGALVALDAGDGGEFWRVDAGPGADSSPVVTGGMVFVGGVRASDKAALVLGLGDSR